MSELSTTTHTNSSDVSGYVTRINRLGAVVDAFFSRVYIALNRRARLRHEQRARLELYRQNLAMQHQLTQREKELERLHGIVATIKDGIVMLDLDGNIKDINQAARHILGAQLEHSTVELSSLVGQYQEQDRFSSELTPLHEPKRLQVQDRAVACQLAAVSNAEGNRIGTLVVLRDVTEVTFGDKLKDQFVTAISHELRTPMNVIKMSSEVLLGTEEGKAPNRRMLELIERNVHVLDRMIVELLDISEMSAGGFHIRQTPIHVEQVMMSVINGLMTDLKRAQLDVSFMVRDSELLYINGDESRLRWALGHLIQNSINYTEPRGHIMVMMNCTNHEYVTIQIVDTGVGILAKDLPFIFDRFYRGEARNAKGKLIDPRGLGQGLYIAKTVAEAHNGQLNVQSTPAEGSTFTMVLPLAS